MGVVDGILFVLAAHRLSGFAEDIAVLHLYPVLRTTRQSSFESRGELQAGCTLLTYGRSHAILTRVTITWYALT